MKDKVGGGGGFVKTLPKTEPQTTVLFQILGIGQHERKMYKSDETALTNEMRLFFELPFDLHEFGKEGEKVMKPLIINRKVKRSLDNRANLYKLLLGFKGSDWMAKMEAGDGIDWNDLLGDLGLVTVSNDKSKTTDAVYSNIESLTRLPNGMPIPDMLFNEKAYFDITDPIPDWEAFTVLFPWCQLEISDSFEWSELLKAKLIPAEVIEMVTENAQKKADRKAGKDSNAVQKPIEKTFEEIKKEKEAARMPSNITETLDKVKDEADDEVGLDPFAPDGDNEGSPF